VGEKGGVVKRWGGRTIPWIKNRAAQKTTKTKKKRKDNRKNEVAFLGGRKLARKRRRTFKTVDAAEGFRSLVRGEALNCVRNIVLGLGKISASVRKEGGVKKEEKVLRKKKPAFALG